MKNNLPWGAGSGISADKTTLEMTTSTDPAANAAVSTTIVDLYGGVIITLTAAGVAQTIQSPTTLTPGKVFTVINDATSTHSISINGFTITPGEAQSFIWDGSAWGPTDIGITSVPVGLAQGGTGVTTLDAVKALLNVNHDSTLPIHVLQVGEAGTTGQIKLFSEQGATDYTATVFPNAAMTENASYYLPAAKPAGTYFMVMTAAGIMAFDAGTYCGLTGNQTLAGIKTFSSFPITPSENPTTSYQVANKAYVDSVAVGLTPKDACRLATAAVLPACTYDATPGALTLTGDAFGLLAIDSVNVVATNRVLIKNQADAKQNGIFTVETIGAADAYYVLKRATDYDATAEIVRGTFTYITAGSTNAGYQFIQTTAAPTLDTNDIVFGVLYAPLADTLDTITDRGATTTNELTMGGIVNTKGVTESGIKNITVADTPYTVLATDRHVYGKTVGGAINVLLPPATGSGRIISFNKRDVSTNIMTITADTTGTPDLINGSATKALENIYDSLTLQDCGVNEWSNIIRLSDVASNTYRVSDSGRADFKTIGDCITYLNGLSQTEGVRVVVDGGGYDISSTVTVNAPMIITIEGGGVSSTVFNAAAGLLNSNMFEILSDVDFTQVGFEGTDAWVAGTTASFVRVNADNVYCELKDFVMNKCQKGIELIKDSEIFVFNFIISNATVKAIEVNSTGVNKIDVEVGNFDTCAIGIDLVKSSGSDVFIDTLRFLNGVGGIAIKYTPATFTYSTLTIASCEHNLVGTFLSGFDFTLARDADIEVLNCVGEESKVPHAKINFNGNTNVTAVAQNTWTKATFTNTRSYACKFTVANNRLTYQSNHVSDIMMWLGGGVYISSNNAKEVQLAIVKNGLTTTVYGQTQITVDQSARRFTFATVVYLDDVGLNDYFELWVRNVTNSDDPVVSDLNWLVKST